jgi:HD-GYP domain-containing protein (c-di-GMP phosphodiesterase class II)
VNFRSCSGPDQRGQPYVLAVPGGKAYGVAASLFDGLDEATLRRLAEHATVRVVSPGEVLCAHGQQARFLGGVRSGKLEVRAGHHDVTVLDRLGPGSIFGELAFLSNHAHSASVVAIEPSTVVTFDCQAVERVLGTSASRWRALAGGLARKLVRSKEQMRAYTLTLEQQVQERAAQVRRAELEVIQRLAQAAEMHDDDTGEHVVRMSRMCGMLAEAIHMDPAKAELVLLASALHDIGKLGIPAAVLRKPGALSDDERALINTHTTLGARLLAGSEAPLLRMAESIALCHHERWDGGGYPNGLARRDIPLEARICSVCDVFDALISARPYKPAWSVDRAIAEIQAQAGKALDPELVHEFTKLVASSGLYGLAPAGVATAS